MIRIELVGLPGSGKTTLMHELVQSGWHPLPEDYRGNPFWRDAAIGNSKDWLASDIVFLLQHRSLIRGSLNSAAPVVCDFSLVTDRLYVEGRTEGRALQIYRDLHDLVAHELPDATALIYLRISPEQLLARLRKRNRKEESHFTRDALEFLARRLDERMADLSYQRMLRLDLDEARTPSQLAAEVMALR